MDGNVRLTRQHRPLQLLDEQPLTSDPGKRRIQDLVALGGEQHQLDGQPRMGCFQTLPHVLGLPAGQRAFAGRDTQQMGVHVSSFS